MELKVWVDGVVRVVCGLSPDTSCQDVVIALAQAIGQTGRYLLILKLRGTERQLVADDRPLRQLAQLGQLAADVHFILRRTGPSLSDGPESPGTDRGLPQPRPSEPEPLRRREPHKAFTFNLGPSTNPRRPKPSRGWSPSPRASPIPRASPVSFLNPPLPVKVIPSSSSNEEALMELVQQHRKLQDLEIQLQALERETEQWERESSSAPPHTVAPAGEVEELERRLRQNEAELMHGESWEEQLRAEVDRERDMHRRLQQIQSSVDEHGRQVDELQASAAHLQQEVEVTAQRRSSWASEWRPDEVLRPLKQELSHRLLQGRELDATLSETERQLQAAEDTLQDRWELMEELNKELRQCNLQQFIQQTGGSHTEQSSSLSDTDGYLSNAGIMEREQPSLCTSAAGFK